MQYPRLQGKEGLTSILRAHVVAIGRAFGVRSLGCCELGACEDAAFAKATKRSLIHRAGHGAMF